MSTSLPLFDPLFAGKPEPQGKPLSGEDLRDSGIESVLSHTPESYKQRFLDAVRSFPRGALVTAEDVRAIAGDPPGETHFNCMGGLMRSAAAAKLIVNTGQGRNAKRASLHASRLAIWRRV